MIVLPMLPLMGCDGPTAPPPEITGPLFCDVEQRRVFTYDEAKARADQWPDNLRADIKTNETGAEHCGWQVGGRG